MSIVLQFESTPEPAPLRLMPYSAEWWAQAEPHFSRRVYVRPAPRSRIVSVHASPRSENLVRRYPKCASCGRSWGNATVCQACDDSVLYYSADERSVEPIIKVEWARWKIFRAKDPIGRQYQERDRYGCPTPAKDIPAWITEDDQRPPRLSAAERNAIWKDYEKEATSRAQDSRENHVEKKSALRCKTHSSTKWVPTELVCFVSESAVYKYADVSLWPSRQLVSRVCRECHAIDGQHYRVEPNRVRTEPCHVSEDFLCDRKRCRDAREYPEVKVNVVGHPKPVVIEDWPQVKQIAPGHYADPGYKHDLSDWVALIDSRFSFIPCVPYKIPAWAKHNAAGDIDHDPVDKFAPQPTEDTLLEDAWRSGANTYQQYAEGHPAHIYKRRGTEQYAKSFGGVSPASRVHRPQQQLRCTYRLRGGFAYEPEEVELYEPLTNPKTQRPVARHLETIIWILMQRIVDRARFRQHAAVLQNVRNEYNRKSDYHFEIKYLRGSGARSYQHSSVAAELPTEPWHKNAVWIDVGYPEHAAKEHKRGLDIERSLMNALEAGDMVETDQLKRMLDKAIEEARERASWNDAGKSWLIDFDEWNKRCRITRQGEPFPPLPLPPDELGEWLTQLHESYSFFMAARSSWGAANRPPGGAVGHDLNWLRQTTQERTADDNERVSTIERAIELARKRGNAPLEQKFVDAKKYFELHIKSDSFQENMTGDAVRSAMSQAVTDARELVERENPANWEARLANAIDQTKEQQDGLYVLAKMDNSPERLYFLLDHDTTDPAEITDAVNQAVYRIRESNWMRDRRNSDTQTDLGYLRAERWLHVTTLLENGIRIVVDSKGVRPAKNGNG